MKKIALVQPRDLGPNALKKPPMGIMSIAATLLAQGHEVKIIHAEVNNDLRAQIEEYGPDVVGVSTMTNDFLKGVEIAEMVRDINGEILRILGGPHASGCGTAAIQKVEEKTMREILEHFDYAVCGEGEMVLGELIEGKSPNGVCYLDEDGELIASHADPIMDLDELASPTWDDLDVDTYRQRGNGPLDLSVHAKRACRFRCKFCATETVHGKRVRMKSPEKAFEEFIEVLAKTPDNITFSDEDFFASFKWVREFVALLKEYKKDHDFNVEIDTFASINDLWRLSQLPWGEELLADMKEVGFASFTIGIESLNPETLRKHGKDQMVLATMTKEEREAYKEMSHADQNKELVAQHFKTAQAAINIAHKHEMMCMGDYMVGNPGESPEEIEEGFELFCQLENLYLAYSPVFTPFPGTGLWQEAYESGKLKRTEEGKIDWSQFNVGKGAFNEEYIGYNAEELGQKLEIRFYTCERYQKDMEAEIASNPESKKMFKGYFNYLATHRYPDSPEIQQVREKLFKES